MGLAELAENSYLLCLETMLMRAMTLNQNESAGSKTKPIS